MKFILILGIIFLILLISIIAYIKSKVKKFSQDVFGTESLLEGFNKQQMEYATTPKSVAGMTSVHLPRITADFPDFHFDEMKERAEHILVDYLMSIHEGQSRLPDYANSDLKYQLDQYLINLQNKDYKEHFTSIKNHDCQITHYSKIQGKCKIVFQATIQYYHYIENRDGKIIKGSKEILEQGRYNIDIIYIQDRDLVETTAETSLGVNCPNCGAPIKTLGEKSCPYCGCAIVTLNINTWSFSDIREY